jgi:hypothetical protein
LQETPSQFRCHLVSLTKIDALQSLVYPSFPEHPTRSWRQHLGEHVVLVAQPRFVLTEFHIGKVCAGDIRRMQEHVVNHVEVVHGCVNLPLLHRELVQRIKNVVAA